MFIFKCSSIASRNHLLRLVSGMDDTGREKSTKRRTENAKESAKTTKSTKASCSTGSGSRNPVSTVRYGFNQESINTRTSNDTFRANLNNHFINSYKKVYLKSNMQELKNISFNRNDTGSSTIDLTKPQTTYYEKIGGYTRHYETTKSSSKNGVVFKVMSYNVLAQALLETHSYLYSYHNQKNLPWLLRWSKLLREIMEHDADILCLQEVERSHLDNYYVAELQKLGYKMIYKQRTGAYPDGCAIFYKVDTFNLIEHTSVEYYQPNSFLLDRENVGLVAKFALRGNESSEFIVATTHLLYNPRRYDVKVAQIQLLLAEIERIAYKPRGKPSEMEYLPIILTGDFNSAPDAPTINFLRNAIIDYSQLANLNTLSADTQSTNNWIPCQLGVTDSCQHYEIVQQRNKKFEKKLSKTQEENIIRLHHSERRNKWGTNTDCNKEYFNRNFLSHMFNFKSVYNHYNATATDIEATTFQDRWLTVDYIFYSVKNDGHNMKADDKLVLLSKYCLPTQSYLQNIHIPNERFGSDHLSLVAVFKLEF